MKIKSSTHDFLSIFTSPQLPNVAAQSGAINPPPRKSSRKMMNSPPAPPPHENIHPPIMTPVQLASSIKPYRFHRIRPHRHFTQEADLSSFLTLQITEKPSSSPSSTSRPWSPNSADYATSASFSPPSTARPIIHLRRTSTASNRLQNLFWVKSSPAEKSRRLHRLRLPYASAALNCPVDCVRLYRPEARQ